MKFFVKIGIGVSVVTNIFFISLASYTHLTRDARVQENREYIKSVIEKQVYQSIQLTMPPVTGKVNVGNKTN
tara:strand:- start:467 stop:682 length:216 start_codon:yes stop_codon:yes gene_type:complete